MFETSFVVIGDYLKHAFFCRLQIVCSGASDESNPPRLNGLKFPNQPLRHPKLCDITKLLLTKPSVLYVTGFGQGYVSAINQIRENGFKGAILTDTAVVDPQVRKNIRDLKKIVFADAVKKNRDLVDVPLQTLFGYDAALLSVGERGNDFDYSQLVTGIVGYSTMGEVQVPIAIKEFCENGVAVLNVVDE